ncbi:hypothetical protein NLU13_6154 [Sarocladium strictum]|uniref:Uncharacterized protein n=1 Tax=Sarocladium strictum TaxID=5046 RepID=A0AA39GFC9_SARSR|nr:hypothetical protein NLU13_6154 [Sarocladium strictum]
MPLKKELRGPSNFCEWVVGTTIPTILGPEKKSKKQKSTTRDVIKVQVTTDDESGEDTLKISYPRTRGRRKKAASKDGTKPKKVRFEEVPQKSALKKITKAYTISESSEENANASDSSADASSDSSGPTMVLIPEENIRVHAVQVTEDPKVEESSGDESEVDDDPSPTCKCKRCIRGRQKLARRKRKAASCEKLPSEESEDTSNTETDDSDEPEKAKENEKTSEKKADEKKDKDSPKRKGKKKRQKPQPVTVESEDSESEFKDDANNESTTSEDGGKNTSKKKHNKTKQAEQEDQQQKSDKSEERVQHQDCQGDAEKEEKNKKKSHSKGKRAESSDAKQKKDKHTKSYPEAMPGPNPRRPNLIEPIRAEVIQTERVIESQEDPPPNAYYDHANNVLRVYHGPVYGGHHNKGLYPLRDPKNLPLPLGTAHPTQNPYFHGFGNGPPQPQPQPQPPTQDSKPGAQWTGGMWPGMQWPYAPPFAAGPPGPVLAPEATEPPPPPPPPPPVNGSKGAFSDRAGRNNVAPVGVEVSHQRPMALKMRSRELTHALKDGKPNPYYSGSKQHSSPFRSYTKTSPASHRLGAASKAGSRQASASGWNNDGAAGSVKQGSQTGHWGQSNTGGSRTQDAGGWGGSQNQQQTDTWGGGQQEKTQQNDFWGSAGSGGLPDQTGQGGWGKTEEQQNQGWGGEPQTVEETNETTPQSNVMPGTFESAGWGDLTMAADTKGAVEQDDIPTSTW